jgi:hypothetical protein
VRLSVLKVTVLLSTATRCSNSLNTLVSSVRILALQSVVLLVSSAVWYLASPPKQNAWAARDYPNNHPVSVF